jgi:hypothetical protein
MIFITCGEHYAGQRYINIDPRYIDRGEEWINDHDDDLTDVERN